MAKPRAILKRRKAVQNIAKITKTMQMIATAKFKRANDRAVGARPYTDRLTALIADLSAAAGNFTHPLLEAHASVKRVAVLAISSNRGLCGGYNTNVFKALTALRDELAAREVDVELHVAGKKLNGMLRFQGTQSDAFHDHFEDRPTFEEVEAVAGPLVERYINGEIDELHVVYTKFISTARQNATHEKVLPLEPDSAVVGSAVVGSAVVGSAGGGDDAPKDGNRESGSREYIYHPDAASILSDLLPRSVRLHVFQAFLDAAVSEQTARMVAMKAATDNASEMIRDLTMLYNRSRQTLITTELSEIIGGTAALE